VTGEKHCGVWNGIDSILDEAQMKTRTLLSIVLCAAACQQPDSPSRDVAVTANLSKVTAHVGDTVTVSVVATNQGSQSIVLGDESCPRPFEVTMGDGTVVAPYGDLCASVLSPPATLNPGESHKATFQWATDARPSPAESPVALPPGSYQFRGVVFATGVRVSSPPVTITIH
jgi:hypothetical protein